jgi:hypothetical protein
VKSRNRHAQAIGTQLRLHAARHPHLTSADNYNQFDVLFWFGDMNYRTEGMHRVDEWCVCV